MASSDLSELDRLKAEIAAKDATIAAQGKALAAQGKELTAAAETIAAKGKELAAKDKRARMEEVARGLSFKVEELRQLTLLDETRVSTNAAQSTPHHVPARASQPAEAASVPWGTVFKSCTAADALFLTCEKWIDELSDAVPKDAEATLYEPLSKIMLTILREVSGGDVGTAVLTLPASAPEPTAAASAPAAAASAAAAITSPVAHRTRSRKKLVYTRSKPAAAAAARPNLVLLQQTKAHSEEAETNRIPDLSLMCDDVSEEASPEIVSPHPCLFVEVKRANNLSQAGKLQLKQYVYAEVLPWVRRCVKAVEVLGVFTDGKTVSLARVKATANAVDHDAAGKQQWAIITQEWPAMHLLTRSADGAAPEGFAALCAILKYAKEELADNQGPPRKLAKQPVLIRFPTSDAEPLQLPTAAAEECERLGYGGSAAVFMHKAKDGTDAGRKLVIKAVMSDKAYMAERDALTCIRKHIHMGSGPTPRQLQELHFHGVVHLDVRPANIVVTRTDSRGKVEAAALIDWNASVMKEVVGDPWPSVHRRGTAEYSSRRLWYSETAAAPAMDFCAAALTYAALVFGNAEKSHLVTPWEPLVANMPDVDGHDSRLLELRERIRHEYNEWHATLTEYCRTCDALASSGASASADGAAASASAASSDASVVSDATSAALFASFPWLSEDAAVDPGPSDAAAVAASAVRRLTLKEQ